MVHDRRHPIIFAPASRSVGSKFRRRKPLALLLSGLILIAAVAPAAAERVGDGKTKSSKNVLEQLSEMLEAGLKGGMATLKRHYGDGTAKASLPRVAVTFVEPKQVIRSTRDRY